MTKFETNFKKGNMIFKEGDVEDTMFFIKDGKVEISRKMGNAQQVISILGPNDFFGEMALLRKSPRSATATAIQDTTVTIFNRNQFLSLMSTKGEIALKIIDVLILRLKESNDTISKLIQKNQKALVFDSLSKWLKVNATDPNIQTACNWVSTQLGMKLRETEAVIRSLVMMNLVSLSKNCISINEEEIADKVKKLLE